MFFDKDVKLFAQVEVFKFKKDFNFEFGTFELVKVKLLVDVGIVHFFNPHPVIQVFLVFIVQSLIS